MRGAMWRCLRRRHAAARAAAFPRAAADGRVGRWAVRRRLSCAGTRVLSSFRVQKGERRRAAAFVAAGRGGGVARRMATKLEVGSVEVRRSEDLQSVVVSGGSGSPRPASSCVARDANMGHQLAGDNSSWCPKLESRTTHRGQLTVQRPEVPAKAARFRVSHTALPRRDEEGRTESRQTAATHAVLPRQQGSEWGSGVGHRCRRSTTGPNLGGVPAAPTGCTHVATS